MFFNIDSCEIKPMKLPSRTIQTKIIKKEEINVSIPDFSVKKKGISGSTPPKKGAPPFTSETIIDANLSAFSCIVFSFFFLIFGFFIPFFFSHFYDLDLLLSLLS